MSSTFGEALQKAGIKTEIKDQKMTLEEARALDKRVAEPVYQKTAMYSLTKEFVSLDFFSKGEDYMQELIMILKHLTKEKKTEIVTKHTVFGIVQTVHTKHESLSGSKRTSFKKLIPVFLEIKAEMIKKEPKDITEFFLKKISKYEK
jgi:hypothetical protein